MRRHETPPRPDRRRRRPVVEGLELRELMSDVPLSNIPLPNRPTLTPSSYGPPGPGHGAFHGPLAPDGSPNFINRLQQQVYPGSIAYPGSTNGNVVEVAPASTPGPAVPTPAEVAREYFTAVTVGRYTVTPGRFGNQQYTVHASSKQSSSNQFLKGRAQLLVFTPQPAPAGTPDTPTTAATFGAYSGLGVYVPYNALNTSNELIFDLGPQRTATTARVGGLDLPTHLTWTLDPNGVGAFTSPAGFNQGAGVLDIVYTPDGSPRGGAIQSGKITYVFQGLVNTSSVLNSIEKSIN